MEETRWADRETQTEKNTSKRASMKGGGRWRGRTERQRGGRATVVGKQTKAANIENTQSASRLQMPEQSPSKVLPTL